MGTFSRMRNGGLGAEGFFSMSAGTASGDGRIDGRLVRSEDLIERQGVSHGKALGKVDANFA